MEKYDRKNIAVCFNLSKPEDKALLDWIKKMADQDGRKYSAWTKIQMAKLMSIDKENHALTNYKRIPMMGQEGE